MSLIPVLTPSRFTKRGPGAPIALLQHTLQTTGVTSTSRTLAFGSNVTAGSFLAIGISIFTAGIAVTGVSDNLNGAWTQLVARSPSGMGQSALWGFPNSAAGACTVTVTVTTGGSFYIWIQAEYSGMPSTLTVVGTAQANGTGMAQSSGAVTTTGTALLLGMTGSNTGVPNTTAGAGWTGRGNPGTVVSMLLEDQGVGTNGMVAASYAATSATDASTPIWCTLLAAVKSV